MAGMVKGIKRTHYCAQLRLEDAGREVALFGWTQRQRDLGGLVFIDLRDRTGIVQLSFDDDTEKPVFETACKARSEFVLCAVGTVQERSSKNPELPTGDIEVKVSRLEILGESEPPPFEIIENCTTSEAIRMKYLVPSRVPPGDFSALPQSPQRYKQLSRVAGFDRYMQLARCFRDEDLRADRQPEFTQIDFEMSFADMEDIIAVAEGYMIRVFR
ncbi:MAG: Asp-tRNA(Asn)/Glu-tRNA(Gln) amidotransferase GatCAB subunit C, partial [Clostridiales bacterium]|nr:Asp-tRNA(Asn)/Glu-tRNA(Gln) amidotransferase GatCAB subunit C [Clostridiales bacterium]